MTRTRPRTTVSLLRTTAAAAAVALGDGAAASVSSPSSASSSVSRAVLERAAQFAQQPRVFWDDNANVHAFLTFVATARGTALSPAALCCAQELIPLAALSSAHDWYGVTLGHLKTLGGSKLLLR